MLLRRLLLRAIETSLGPVAAGALVAFTAVRLSARAVPRSSSVIAFTPSVAVGSGGLAVASAWLGHRRSAMVLTACSAALGAVVAPRARARPQPTIPAGAPQTLTLLSANCLKGRADAAALVELVRTVGPDVLALQEQNAGFIGRLAAAGLFDLLPHHVQNPGNRMSDAALVSRYPVREISSDLSSVFCAAEATLPGGRRLPLISFHPLPPVGRSFTRRWIRDMAAMPAPAGAFAGGLVAGDFNATLDHPEFRALLTAGWRDAGAERGEGLRATWTDFALMRLTIDHVLVPPGAAVRGYRVHHLKGSDHRAISVVVDLPPA